MKASELFHSLAPEDEGKVYWIAAFGLNAGYFGKYYANTSPVQAVVTRFENTLRARQRHHESSCTCKYASISFTVLNKDGTLSNKEVNSRFLSAGTDYELEAYDTEEEALEAYILMVENGIQQLDDAVLTQSGKLQNTLQTAVHKQEVLASKNRKGK